MATISIVVPVYNSGKYLRTCIDSIIAQSFPDFELLLINDGSTDDSPVICDEYAQSDPRIKVYHQPNAGPSAARNLGIKLAQGEYLTFIDSDDYIDKDMINCLLNTMRINNCDLVISGLYVEMMKRGKKRLVLPSIIQSGKLNNTPEEAHKILQLFEHRTINGPCGKLYKMSIIRKKHLRMPDGVHFAEDLLFNIDYLSNTESIYIAADRYYYYIQKKVGSLTTQYVENKFLLLDLAHDKLLHYMTQTLKAERDIVSRAYYFVVINTYSSFLNLFYKQCSMTKKEKMHYISAILNNTHVMTKLSHSNKPGMKYKILRLLLKTKFTGGIYYLSKILQQIKLKVAYII